MEWILILVLYASNMTPVEPKQTEPSVLEQILIAGKATLAVEPITDYTSLEACRKAGRELETQLRTTLKHMTVVTACIQKD